MTTTDVRPFLMTEVYEKQDLTARIDLFEETIFLTRYTDAGQVATCIEVDPTSLVSAFKGTPIATGILPQNTVYYALVDGQESIAIYIPPTVRTVTVRDQNLSRKYHISQPPLIFHGHARTFHLWAVRAYPHEKTHLYNAPFPNVSIGGSICRGNVRFPVAGRTSIRACFRAFMTSAFNDHLIQNKSQSHPDDIRALWECLNHCSIIYPIDDLIRQSRATLGSVLGEMRR